jgi:hypothetical protein
MPSPKPYNDRRAEAERKGCASKTKFYFEDDAKNQALVLRSVHGVAVRHYRCRFCDGWHLSRSYG